MRGTSGTTTRPQPHCKSATCTCINIWNFCEHPRGTQGSTQALNGQCSSHHHAVEKAPKVSLKPSGARCVYQASPLPRMLSLEQEPHAPPH